MIVMDNGDSQFRKRLSPRLHHNPHCHSNSHFVSDSFLSSPKMENSSTVSTSFIRRMSPRLHVNGNCGNANGNGDGPQSQSQSQDAHEIQSRLSPRSRTHPNLPTHEDASKDSVIQRRLSPRLNLPSAAMSPLHHHSHSTTISTAPHHPNHHLHSNTPIAARLDASATTGFQAKVKEALRIFNTYYLQFFQENEERKQTMKTLPSKELKKRKRNQTNKGKKAKIAQSQHLQENDNKRTSNRPDLKALSKMNGNKEILHQEKRIGHVPGVDVGYQFYSRAEMVAVGVHSHWLSGIDFIGKSKAEKDGKFKQYALPIAVAVVMSGQYEDDQDNYEDILYTGQGGHDLVGSKLQKKDQKLVGGNLALKNSMEQSVPVRVIRGLDNPASYSGKIYSYDGLYQVVETLADRGQRGHLIYKYRLKRFPGQPKLTTEQVEFVKGCQSKTPGLRGLVCRDMTNGQEGICIPVTNIYDDPPVGPPGFTYIKAIETTESVKLPPNVMGCSCKGNCSNLATCACARLNGSDFPYVRHRGGRLVEAKDIVFECGPNCGCGPECLNRTSQRGIKYHLEVYRTLDKGWAVRTRDYIPSGAPVCEYIGVLSRSDELDNVAENNYIFEIDCLHTMNEIEGRECILNSHHEPRLARVVLFAADNIPPLQELTYDYGYALDSVVGPDGKVKESPCFCGTADCRKRLY